MDILLHHVPVMVKEVIYYLNIKPNGIYVDCTIGKGGHTKEILTELSQKGKIIGIDRDPTAIEMCSSNFSSISSQISLHNSSYHNLSEIFKLENIYSVDGILVDLGLSSMQLNQNDRGFSFSNDSILDLRFNKNEGAPFYKILKKLSLKEVEQILIKYGEERFSKKIAYKIIESKNIKTVFDLKNIIIKSTPPKNRNKSFARVFQAFRIFVNKELEILEKFLHIFIKNLSINGRIVIVSYHSLEDRLVKHAFKNLKINGNFNILTKKPIVPKFSEIKMNRRSRSAKLRAGEKV